jgi:hypothetical protein
MPAGITALAGFATILMTPWWCVAKKADPTALQGTGRPAEAEPTRVSPGTDGVAKRTDFQMSDEVVLRALDERQASFMRCFERAQRMDGIGRVDVKLHLEVDALGVVRKATNDAINDRLRTCVSAVAMHLVFSEPGRPVVLDVPLLFR